MEQNLTDKLAAIQRELKAPKGQFNAFGKYKYRNCEDILEALKPLLDGTPLTISDELVMIGDRYYVKATVNFGGIITTAYAREEQDKKGMDASQITGAASSYARKYALNGLFLIDDTKDADATNDHGKTETKATPPPHPDVPDFPPPTDGVEMATPEQVKKINIMLKEKGFTERQAVYDLLTGFCNRLIKSTKDLTKAEASLWIKEQEGK